MTRTYVAKPSEITRKWYIVDASGKVLGRMATQIARILQGKHKPTYTPHTDTGDFVVVVNAEKVVVTGRKAKTKLYYHASGYPGGLKQIAFEDLIVKKPTEPVILAVRRMVPRTTLGKQMFKKLKVYAGPEHPHAAQQPETLNV